MVLLGREMVCSHRLSIQITVISGTIWQQFTMQVLTGGSQLEMGPEKPSGDFL